MESQSLQEFDYAGAIARINDDREIYDEVLAVFLQSIPELFDEMEAALQLGDLPSVERYAHTIKSASYTIGGLRLGALAEEIERSIASVSNEWIAEKIKLLHSFFIDLRTILTDKGLIVK
jgi:HPt (histidine-containing phosphotransfer) domain-containing protein